MVLAFVLPGLVAAATAEQLVTRAESYGMTCTPSAADVACDLVGTLVFGIHAVIKPRSGQETQPGESVVSRTVRKTRIVMCDGILEPLFDVTFEIAPSGTIVVTLGKLPDGRLFACTY